MEKADEHALAAAHNQPTFVIPIYMKIMGSVAGGLILAHLLHLNGAIITDEYLMGVLLAKKRELTRAKRKLAVCGVTYVSGEPLRIDWDVHYQAILTYIKTHKEE